MSAHSAATDLLADRDDVVLLDEAHLDVELGELRLAVGAEVLVAVAAGDLVVALHAGHHEQLLEQLRRLRQGVPGARLQADRHQEVARALRASSGSASASRSRGSPRRAAPRGRRG
jgi:hypothetical protein